MKKFLTLLSVVVIIAVSACQNEQTPSVKKGLTITVKADTSIKTVTPITAPRISCEGKTLRHPKLLGETTKVLPIRLTRDTTISTNDLEKMGWYYGGKNGNGSSVSTASSADTTDGLFSGMPDWLKTLLLWLLWLVILLVALWLLWQILSWLWRNLSSWNRPVVQPVTPPAPVSPSTPAPSPQNDAEELQLHPVIKINVSPSATVRDIIVSIGADARGGVTKDARNFSRNPGKSDAKNTNSEQTSETPE